MATFITEFDVKVRINVYAFFHCCNSRTYHNPVSRNIVIGNIKLKIFVFFRIFDKFDYI